MKHLLLFLLPVVLLLQSGCANSPTIEEQAQHDQQEGQATKRNEAFARGLQQ